MSLDFHQKALQSICRVCGKKLGKKKDQEKQECKPVKVEGMEKCIDAVWGINTWLDVEGIFPTYICHICHRLIRHDESGDRPAYRSKHHPNIDWVATRHSRTGHCIMCKTFQAMRQRGWPQPIQWPIIPVTIDELHSHDSAELPFKLDSVNIFQEHEHLTSTPHLIPYTLDIVGRATAEQSLFTCAICLCILSDPVECPCQHNFCSSCLSQYFQFHKSPSVKCPLCRAVVNFHYVKTSPPSILVPLDHLTVSCYMCGAMGTMPNFVRHQCPCPPKMYPCPCSQCTNPNQDHPSSRPRPNNSITEATTLLDKFAQHHQSGDPLPQTIEKMADKWILLKFKASQDNTATIRTGGTVSLIQIFNKSCQNQTNILFVINALPLTTKSTIYHQICCNSSISPPMKILASSQFLMKYIIN